MNLEDAEATPRDLVHLQDPESKPKALLGDSCEPEIAAHAQSLLIARGFQHGARWGWKDTASPRSHEAPSECICFARSRHRKTDRNINSDNRNVGMIIEE